MSDDDVPGPEKPQEALRRAIAERGVAPESITVDNGSEFSRKCLDAWVTKNGVHLCFIRPGRSVENSFIESFNGRLRDECLNVEWFPTLDSSTLGVRARLCESYFSGLY